MRSIFTRFTVLACFCLVACAPQTRVVSTNPVNNEKIRSARVIYEKAASLQVNYEVSRYYGAGQALPAAIAATEPIIKAIRERVPGQVTEALAKRGIPPGMDTLIYLRPVRVFSNSNMGNRVELEITVQSGDPTKPRWVATIIDGRGEGWMGTTAESNAAAFSSRVVMALATAGFISQ